jgi:hypothetical protein
MKANAWSLYWNSLSPRRRKQVVWILGLLVFYAIVGFLILPPIVRAVAVKQLSQQLDREVSIEKIKINPFAFSTTIRGLLIKDKDGQPFISWDEVYVNFQLMSFLGHPWVFREIRVTGPYVRAQMNKDYTFNFSDLITKFVPTNAPATPAKPLGLRIYRLEITNATASVTDLTHSHPFKRLVGPISFTMENFRTDPDNKNPHTCTGTTDAGEKIAWSGFFYLDPVRSWGELTVENFALNKYTPLYEDFLPVEIRDGVVGLNVHYHVDLSATNHVMEVTNTSFALRNFIVAEPGGATNLLELANLAVTGVSADALTRRADIDSVSADGGRLNRLRTASTVTNVIAQTAVKAAKSVINVARQLNSVQELLGLITNGVTQLLQSTNLGTVTVRDVEFTNCALHLEDLTTMRPARLDLDDVTLSVKNVSNLAKTNLTAGLSLRWNTNGAIKIDSSVSFAPLTADADLALDRLDFGTLAPYLESALNVLIPDSQFGLHGQVQVRTPEGQLPEINFRGETWLDGLRVVDGVIGEDLLKWDSVRVSGIEANVNPLSAAIQQITVDNVAAHVVIDTNQTIIALAALKPVGATNPPVETTASGTNAPAVDETRPPGHSIADQLAALTTLPPFSIGSIVISNTSASYTDRSLTPNVNMTVLEFGGTIAGISSTNRSQPTDVDLSAKVNGVGPVNVTGTLYPFTVTGTNDVKITLKDMDLTPVSPYSGKFAGYRIALGKLNLDLAYNLVGTELKSTNIITLDRFTFGEKVESPDATQLPVRLAIALLKDRNGQILLEVPVDGRLDDPKFHVSKVVWETLLNILTKAATSPFSLIGAAFGGGGEELGYQDFVPGRSELTPDDNKKLDTLVKALYDRPGLSLEIAGSIDPVADRDGLQRVFLEKQIHLKKWQSLRKSKQAAVTPDQVALTPEERTDWVKELYHEAWANHQITPEMLAANTNIAEAVAQLRAKTPKVEKGATILVKGVPTPTNPVSGTGAGTASELKLPPVTDPMEVVLLASIPVTDNDFEALAADRAKTVNAYILASGKVEATRLFLKENQTGGVRSEGSRVYLQFQ